MSLDSTSTVTIKRRTYRIELIPTGDSLRDDLQRRGWNGQCYLLHGKRNAVHLAYQSAKNGEFTIVR